MKDDKVGGGPVPEIAPQTRQRGKPEIRPEIQPEIAPEIRPEARPIPEVAPELRPIPEVAPGTRPIPEVAPDKYRPIPEVAPGNRPIPEVAPEIRPIPEVAPEIKPEVTTNSRSRTAETSKAQAGGSARDSAKEEVLTKRTRARWADTGRQGDDGDAVTIEPRRRFSPSPHLPRLSVS